MLSRQQEIIDEVNESRLLTIINQYRNIEQEFERKLKQDLQIILLVGSTGAGKSTLFNFLAGAKFKFIDDPVFGDELTVASLNGSPICSGMTSITKEPYYYFIESENHLLIDFPGFQDTRGEIEQLLVQLFFHKLVTKAPVKIVYVLRHPENQLSDRGQSFQEFIKAEFKEQNLDICKFTIILSCYNQGLKDQDLILRFSKQFNEKYKISHPQNVIVVRKAQNENELAQIFSDENRVILLQNIIKTNPLIFTPNSIPHTEIITDYLQNAGEKTIANYCLQLNEILNEKVMGEIQSSTLSEIQNSLEDFITLFIQDQGASNFIWFENFHKECNRLAQQLGIKRQNIEQYDNFEIIFHFFSDLANFIKGYQHFSRSCFMAINQTRIVTSALRLRIQQLKDLEQSNCFQNQIELQNKQILDLINQLNYERQLRQWKQRSRCRLI